MTIHISTDNDLPGAETILAFYVAKIESKLSRFSEHITRIKVQLSDKEVPSKGQNTKRCMLEARLELRLPLIVSNDADTLDEAVDGAVVKLKSSLETIMSKMSNI